VNTAAKVAVLACLGVVLAAVLIAVNARRTARAPRAARDAAREGGPPPAATDLMSDFEVSRAIGVSVEAHGTRTEAAYHPQRGGDSLLQVSVLGRRGGVVVVLRQHDPSRWRVIGGLPWLLSTALDRVPRPGQPPAGPGRAPTSTVSA
jgi:hypothetical protein